MSDELPKSKQQTGPADAADTSPIAADAGIDPHEAVRSAHEAATKAVVDSQKSAGLA